MNATPKHSLSRRILGLLPLLLILTGCELNDVLDDGRLEVVEETFHYSVPFEEGRIIDLDGINGSVHVEYGSTQGEIVIRGTKKAGARTQAKAREEMTRLLVEVGQSSSGTYARTQQPSTSGSDRSYTVDYILEVPATAKVIVDNDNGIVTTSGHGVTPDIHLLNGSINMSTSDGGATIAVVNGNIIARLQSLDDHPLELTTVNGNVDLGIPTSASARLLASVTNGLVRVEGLNVATELASDHAFVGTMGQAGSMIDVHTTNGNINIHPLDN